MTRFLVVMLMVVVWMACERDFRAGTGYGVGPGYTNAGYAYGAGGGTLSLQDASDQASTPQDSKPQGDTSDLGTGDAACEGTPTYCSCMAEYDGRSEYCQCQETQPEEHPEDNFYCLCNHLLCVENEFSSDTFSPEAYRGYCLGLYPVKCEPYFTDVR